MPKYDITGKTVNAWGASTIGYKQSISQEYNGGASGSGTVNVSWEDGVTQTYTLTGNCTFDFADAMAGRTYVLRLVQDNIGGRTVTWPVNVKWGIAGAPVLSTLANKTDIITFYFDSTVTYYGGWIGSF